MSRSTNNRLFRRWDFAGNHLHWYRYWQLRTERENT